MQGKPVAEQEIGKLLLLEPCRTPKVRCAVARRCWHYFGEEYPEENCGCCEQLPPPQTKIDAQASLRMALDRRCANLGDKFKADYLASVLVGKNTALVPRIDTNLIIRL